MLLLVALALLVAAPATASAATVSTDGTTVTLVAGPGERNLLSVSLVDERIRITDRGPVPVAEPGCTVSERTASCAAAAVTNLVLDLGDQGDTVTLGRSITLPTLVRGGTGNDTMTSGTGADRFEGGSGRDTASYSGRTDGVTVTLGGGADDGRAGEGDNLISVERVIGTRANDVMFGKQTGDRLQGGPGDDQLDGGPGNDTLVGGQGFDAMGGGTGNDVFLAEGTVDGGDVFNGGEGTDRVDYSKRRAGVVADADGRQDDGSFPNGLDFTGSIPVIALLGSDERDLIQPDVERIRGGEGDDVLQPPTAGGSVEGRGGTDVLLGGPGRDRFDGGTGFDRILARDGNPETVICGEQTDRAYVDVTDIAGGDCESVASRIAVALAPLQSSLRADGTVAVRVACPAQAWVRCVGVVRASTVRRLGKKPVALGSARFSAAPGTVVDLRITIPDAGRAALRRFGPATRVRLVGRGRDEAGPARDAIRRFVLRAAR